MPEGLAAVLALPIGDADAAAHATTIVGAVPWTVAAVSDPTWGKLPAAPVQDGSPKEKPVLIDTAEAARILNISEPALRQRKQRGQIPKRAIVQTGKRVQFRRDELENIGRKR